MDIHKWLDEALVKVKESDPYEVIDAMDKHGLLACPESWVAWQGKEDYPELSAEDFVQVELRSGEKDQGLVKDFRWKHKEKPWSLDIVKYRR